ncbi:hypothetical protein QJQ45_029896 [Haematococcus lacustris]|nr:hypothetical protein QJQ45_029896 [Haematococcus lacustris]
MQAAKESAASSRASKLLMDLLPSHIVAALLLEATDEEEDRKEEEEEEEEGKGGGWTASLSSSKAGLTSTHPLIDSGHSHHNPSPPANLPPPKPEHAGQQQPVHAPANSNEGGLDTQPLLDAPPSLVSSSAADMPAAGQAGCRRGCLDAVAVAPAAAVLTSSGTWQALPPLSCAAGLHPAAHSAVKTADALGHSAWVPPSSHLAKAAAAAAAAATAATAAGVEGAGAAAAASCEGAAAGYRASQAGQSEGVMELKAAHMASPAVGPEPSHLGQPWPTVLGRCSSSSGMVVPGGLTQPVLTKQVSLTQALVELRQGQLQAVVGGQQGQPCLQLLHLAPPAEAGDAPPSAVGAAAAAGGSLGDGKAAAGASASGSCWLGIAAAAGQPMPRQRSTADAHERLSLVAAKGQQGAKAVDGPGRKPAGEDPGLVSKSRTTEAAMLPLPMPPSPATTLHPSLLLLQLQVQVGLVPVKVGGWQVRMGGCPALIQRDAEHQVRKTRHCQLVSCSDGKVAGAGAGLGLGLGLRVGLDLRRPEQGGVVLVLAPCGAGRRHEQVSILFSDIVGFSSLSAEVAPEAVFAMLNELYSHFDELTQSMPSVYKIETIGDSYMVTAGLLVHDPEHAATMVRFGLAMQQVAAQVMMPNGAGPVQMRIGIHSGPVLSGVIGKIRKRFCLVGHTVNCASRMESGGIPGRIQVSSSTHALLQHCTEFQWESRGPIEVKGLGTMTPYLLVPLDTKGVDILLPQDGITGARSAVRGEAATAAEELLTGQEHRPLPRDSLSCDPHKRASSLAQLPAASTARRQCNIAEVSDTLVPHYGTGEAASAVKGDFTTSLSAERKHAFVSNSSLELWEQRGHLQCERSTAAFDGFGQFDTVDVAASSTNATHENYLGQLSDIDGIESGFESALWDCASAHELHMLRIQGWSQEGRLSSNSVRAPASVSQSNSATWPLASPNADNHISTRCASPVPDGASSVHEHTARLARQRHDEEQALSAELYDVFYPRHDAQQLRVHPARQRHVLQQQSGGEGRLRQQQQIWEQQQWQ